ncbi:MAG: hypothetical protein Q9204_002463 [Flavoplaca sp. TL-2023a]
MPRDSTGRLGIRSQVADSLLQRKASYQGNTAPRIPKLPARDQPQIKRQRVQEQLSQVQHVPSLRQEFLQQLNDDYELPPMPAGEEDENQSVRMLSNVAIKPLNTAICITNELLSAIENAPLDDPIIDALDHDDHASQSDELYDMLEDVIFEETEAGDDQEAPQEPDFGVEEDEDTGAREQPQTSEGVWGMPPTRRSSTSTVKDDSEPVPHRRSDKELDPFTFALGLWCEVSKITRHQYQSLLEVFRLAEDLNSLRTLPGTITTMQKYVRQQLPLLPLRRRLLNLHPDKLPTMTPNEKAQETDVAQGKGLRGFMYFFDVVELFQTVIASPEIRRKMHFGPAHFVPKPSEFYHSNAWASSILSCSGQFASYPDGRPLFPSDIIAYECGDEDCSCTARDPHLGRVFAVGKDFLSDITSPSYGSLLIQIQKLYPASRFSVELRKHPKHPLSNAKELLLAHKEFCMIPPHNVLKRILDIHTDYRYEGIQGATYPAPVNYSSEYIIRNTVVPARKEIDPLQLSPPPRGELELAHYGRPHLERYAVQKTLSIPLIVFIDAFGVYRNMYRSLMGIYATVAALNWRERKRRSNVFPLTLGPYASEFSDVLQTLQPNLSQLHEGNVVMDIDGEETILLAYTLASTGDMPQQASSGSFASPQAMRGCSKCLVTKEQRANLTFDIYHNARAYYRVIHERAKGEALLRMDPVDCVVHCYANIARSNAVILSLSISQEDRDQLDWLLRQNRKSFQRLFECATIASTPNFKRGGSTRSQTLTATPSIAPLDTSFSDFMDEVSSLASVEEEDEGVLTIAQRSQLQDTFTIDGANKKALAFNAHLSRPNVHIALHFSDVATEYATPNNVTTFTGEDKHRGYKAAVTRTNKHDIVKTLLSQESFQQCLRFALAGSYLEKDSRLSDRLQWIHRECPSLLKNLLPQSEQKDSVSEEEEGRISIIGDDMHLEPLAIGCLKVSWVKKYLGWPIRSGPKMEDMGFAKMLQDAYLHEYNEPHVTLPNARLQWCSKMSFTDPTSEHRVTFKVGDFVRARGTLARVDGLFAHDFSSLRRMLFARVTWVEGFSRDKVDPILQTPYQRLSKRYDIVGLPGIGPEKLFMLNVRRRYKEHGGVALERGGSSLLLHCNYDIQFM